MSNVIKLNNDSLAHNITLARRIADDTALYAKIIEDDNRLGRITGESHGAMLWDVKNLANQVINIISDIERELGADRQ